MLKQLLCDHDGVITLDQAAAVGLSRQAVYRRVKSGLWQRCSPGVYFVDDRPFTDSARVRAAVWGFGDRAAASGLAAAWWHGLTTFAPNPVEVTVPKVSNHPRYAGTRPRRRDLGEADVVELRGLQVTTLPLTVVEAAARRGGGMRILDAALQRQLVNLRELWGAHLRHKGRHGSPAARILLQAADGGARSAAERLFQKLLEDAGITGWQTNYRIGKFRADFAFPDEGVAIEIDGLAVHSTAEVFQKDRGRQNGIVLMNWVVLRFTWLDLVEYPDRVLATLRRALRFVHVQ